MGEAETSTLKGIIQRICELQPQYSSDNSEAMQERGRLIRQDLANAIKARGTILRSALREFGDDFHVGASDGVGRKTELPWVRFCSKIMSPTPQQGFYCVIHFSTNGSAVHFTVGCGSSRYRVRDTSASNPYDFEAEKGEERVKIEIKGTTSDLCDAILMTRNEVKLHRKEKGRTALFIVYGIKISGFGDSRIASGGTLDVLWAWDIDSCVVEPTAYRIQLAKGY